MSAQFLASIPSVVGVIDRIPSGNGDNSIIVQIAFSVAYKSLDIADDVPSNIQ